MKALTPAERRALRAQAHHLNPIIMIGDAGLTPGVIREIDLALKSHELIKIRVLGEDRERRHDLLPEICAALDASPVQEIGKMLVIFRPLPEEEKAQQAAVVRRKRKKQPFRPKRAFQNRYRATGARRGAEQDSIGALSMDATPGGALGSRRDTSRTCENASEAAVE
jgi:putative YhbY family RNA-binding protein